MKKIFTSLLTFGITFVSSFSTVLANGNNPYGHHNPVDTGVDDLGWLFAVGFTVFIVGVVLFSLSNYFSSKLKKDL